MAAMPRAASQNGRVGGLTVVVFPDRLATASMIPVAAEYDGDSVALLLRVADLRDSWVAVRRPVVLAKTGMTSRTLTCSSVPCACVIKQSREQG